MIYIDELKQHKYKISDVANYLEVTPQTLRKWEKEGKIKFNRTKGNQRFLTRDDLIKELKSSKLLSESDEKWTVDFRRIQNIEELYDTLGKNIRVFSISSTFSLKDRETLCIEHLLAMIKAKEVKQVVVNTLDDFGDVVKFFIEDLLELLEIPLVFIKNN